MGSTAGKAEHPSKLIRPKDPTDQYYEALMVNLEALTEVNDKVELNFIHKYLNATRRDARMHPEQIFRVNRHGEDVAFKAHDSLKNRRLLWHGTSVAVVAAILKSGLRIMPHSGGRVGKGIYMASENGKSASYVGTTGKGAGRWGGAPGVGFMFLVEAALGKEHEIQQNKS